MEKRHKFAAGVFRGAGLYGLVVLLPQYFLEEKLGRDFPPPLTHPEHFYGFLGVAVAWQFAFLFIARNVQRHRLVMLRQSWRSFRSGSPRSCSFRKAGPPRTWLVLASLTFCSRYCLCWPFVLVGARRLKSETSPLA